MSSYLHSNYSENITQPNDATYVSFVPPVEEQEHPLRKDRWYILWAANQKDHGEDPTVEKYLQHLNNVANYYGGDLNDADLPPSAHKYSPQYHAQVAKERAELKQKVDKTMATLMLGGLGAYGFAAAPMLTTSIGAGLGAADYLDVGNAGTSQWNPGWKRTAAAYNDLKSGKELDPTVFVGSVGRDALNVGGMVSPGGLLTWRQGTNFANKGFNQGKNLIENVAKRVSAVKNLPTTIQRRTITNVPSFFGKIGLSDISNWMRGYGKQLSFKDYNKIKSTLEKTIPDGSHQDVLNRLNFIYKSYGIPTISDDVAKLNGTDFLNYITKELEKQNTFTRGVRLTAEDTKLPINEQLKKYEQYAVEYAPETGHGRADIVTHAGNLDYLHGKGNSGTIYLSNSYDQADAYALASVRNKKAGDADGKIAVVRFPLTPYKGDMYQYIYDNLPLTEMDPSFVANAQSVLLSQHKPKQYRNWYLYSDPTSQLATTPAFIENFNQGQLSAHQLWKTRIKYNADRGGGFSFRKGNTSLTHPGIALRHTILRGEPGTASPLELIELRDPSKFNIFRTRYHTGRIAKDLSDFKSGGTIHIKKKNLGSFTRYCNGKVTEECIRKGKNSSNPTTRKRANFAANARQWKHEEGGKLNYLNYFQ